MNLKKEIQDTGLFIWLIQQFTVINNFPLYLKKVGLLKKVQQKLLENENI